MRRVLVCLLIAACGPLPQNDDAGPIPDAQIVNDCEGTTLQLDVPVAGEHYDPANLSAQATVSAFDVENELDTQIYDDAGNTFQPTGAPSIEVIDASTDWVTWHFANLGSGTRYTWEVYAVDCDRTETFFTN